MKVVVDWLRCDGNGSCVVEAPDVFDLNDDDELLVLQEQPGEDQRGPVEAAVSACPKRALAIEG
jgi:ferredoxin